MKETRMIPQKHFNWMFVSYLVILVAFLIMLTNTNKGWDKAESVEKKYLDHMMEEHPELSH